MKIIYISNSVIPSRSANSIHVMKMCQALVANGHEVILLAPGNEKSYEPDVECLFSYYGVDPCFEIIKMPWLSVKGKRYLYSFFAAFKSFRLKPDLVIGRDSIGCSLSAFMMLPVIFESHSPISDKGRIEEWFFRRLINSNNFKRLIVITHSLKEDYLNSYPSLEDKVHVLPDGADPLVTAVVPIVLENSCKRLQVGYVGHLYRGKGMEIISKLAEICDSVDFHIVGGKSFEIQFWQEKIVANNIKFHGYVPHSEVNRFLVAFDVLLLPNQKRVSSHGGDEADIGKWTSPLKAFEYMAVGKPIVASDLPVLREIFRNGENAILCDPEDVLAWAEAILRLTYDKSLGDRISQAAHNDLIYKYAWFVRASNLLEGVDDSFCV